METTELIMIVIGAVFTVGGFVATIAVAVLGYFVKRLISSVDHLTDKLETLELALKDKPDHTWVEKTAENAAEHRVVAHERDHHGPK